LADPFPLLLSPTFLFRFLSVLRLDEEDFGGVFCVVPVFGFDTGDLFLLFEAPPWPLDVAFF
jgi:hypothetical protein